MKCLSCGNESPEIICRECMELEELEQEMYERYQDEQLLNDFDELYDVSLEDMPRWFFRAWVDKHYPQKNYQNKVPV